MALTETIIRRLPIPDKEKLIGDQRGLYLRCYPISRQNPKGRKTWLFRSRVGGSWKTRNLGEWPAVSLAQARVKASVLAGKILPESVTFGALLDEWYERRIAPHYKVVRNARVYVARGKRDAGNDKLSQLTTARLTCILTDYAKKAPVSSNRCLGAWKLALDYAVERGYIERNPLERTTTRSVGGPEQARNRHLTDAEIRIVWADTHEHAPLLKFLLLTGLRISEAQGARREHIEGDRLHIPENKSSRPHWVFLPPLAKRLTGDHNGYLFAQRSPTAIQARLKRAEAGWTPHDLRRTFATRLAGLGVAPHVVEKMLNHTMGGVMDIYNRHDYATEREQGAIAWAHEVERITAN